MNSVLDAALQYAQSGARIFPCSPATKAPLVRWSTEASCDPVQIKRWWTHWPAAMIGLPTGSNIGAFVIDVDAGTDPNTGETFRVDELIAQIERLGGARLAQTLSARTPRGGMHLFFAMPAGLVVTNARGNLPKRVDIRGQGGYVIAAPSIRADGTAYEWIDATMAEVVQAISDCIPMDAALARAA